VNVGWFTQLLRLGCKWLRHFRHNRGLWRCDAYNTPWPCTAGTFLNADTAIDPYDRVIRRQRGIPCSVNQPITGPDTPCVHAHARAHVHTLHLHRITRVQDITRFERNDGVFLAALLRRPTRAYLQLNHVMQELCLARLITRCVIRRSSETLLRITADGLLDASEAVKSRK